ncbi:DUF1642 domain-containing protein [Sporosarcina sp. FSL K6-1508]|uniref:DUF1642 domain-containing protein n=1 Tax=Sporosarcina sp. FSL K6-1508 TaxID=2921553 RepID=UPI0030FCD6DB
MTEKVKVPSGVDDAIKWAREKGYTDCGIVLATQFVPIKFNFEVIARWMVEGDGKNDDKLLNALVNGYEVEPEHKVGDWAKVVFTSGGQAIGIVDTLAFDDIIFDYLDQNTEVKRCRIHRDCATTPTPEEIKTERERRLWAKIDRKPYEVKDDDVMIIREGRHDNSLQVKDFDKRELHQMMRSGDIIGFYPVESFISFEEVESNA